MLGNRGWGHFGGTLPWAVFIGVQQSITSFVTAVDWNWLNSAGNSTQS